MVLAASLALGPPNGQPRVGHSRVTASPFVTASDVDEDREFLGLRTRVVTGDRRLLESRHERLPRLAPVALDAPLVARATQYAGNAAGNWESIECSSTDNNTNWGANGQAPDPNFSHAACYLNCACAN
ncbi:hypothetical protein ACNOYE_00485 [Nannocystaceae bacterium ST9]